MRLLFGGVYLYNLFVQFRLFALYYSRSDYNDDTAGIFLFFNTCAVLFCSATAISFFLLPRNQMRDWGLLLTQILPAVLYTYLYYL
jgi:hypothetical protein